MKRHAGTLVKKLEDFRQKWEKRGSKLDGIKARLKGEMRDAPLKEGEIEAFVDTFVKRVRGGQDPGELVERWERGEDLRAFKFEEFGEKVKEKLGDRRTYELLLEDVKAVKELDNEVEELRKEIVSELDKVMAKPLFMEECVAVRAALEGLRRGFKRF